MRAFTGMYQREGDETKPPSPVVTPDRINRLAAKGLRPVLVLDEFDKSVSTDQRKDFLFDLVNSVWLHNGQVIAISNTSYAELAKAWGENFGGGPILRRIGRGDGCHNLAFVKSK